ncbi:hypothetical protein GCM10020254_03490 [Streptomyces goshikiensis]
MLAVAATHRSATGGNLFEDLLAEARATTSRVVLAGEHWTAFVPYAARWPYEVHLYPPIAASPTSPTSRRPNAPSSPGCTWSCCAGSTGCSLKKGGTVQTAPTPYISAWHQAPKTGGQELALHLELFTVRRSAGKLKFLAGVESGMDSFVNDVAPEVAAARLREVAS